MSDSKTTDALDAINEEIGNGVKIILARVKSNPEEFTGDYSPWRVLRNAVLNYKLNPSITDLTLLHGLNDAEITVLSEAFTPLARQAFDEWVMKQVFNESEAPYSQSVVDMIATQNRQKQHALLQNSILSGQGILQPGGYFNVAKGMSTSGTTGTVTSAVATSDTSMLSKIKSRLGGK